MRKRNPAHQVAGLATRKLILAQLFPELSLNEIKELSATISSASFSPAQSEVSLRILIYLSGITAVVHILSALLNRSFPETATEKAECLTLSTLHAAKGLEFKVVFVAWVNDGTLPLAPREEMSVKALKEYVEEERRLLYVRMTRTMEMFISHQQAVEKHL